jgi:hypothetical protein
VELCQRRRERDEKRAVKRGGGQPKGHNASGSLGGNVLKSHTRGSASVLPNDHCGGDLRQRSQPSASRLGHDAGETNMGPKPSEPELVKYKSMG